MLDWDDPPISNTSQTYEVWNFSHDRGRDKAVQDFLYLCAANRIPITVRVDDRLASPDQIAVTWPVPPELGSPTLPPETRLISVAHSDLAEWIGREAAIYAVREFEPVPS